MRPDSPGTLAEILKTTLHLVESRKDLDQHSPSVNRLKESMRKTIDELEKKASTDELHEAGPPALHARWTDVLRKKLGSS